MTWKIADGNQGEKLQWQGKTGGKNLFMFSTWKKNKRFFVGFDACDVLFNEFSCTAFMLHNLLSCEFGFMLYYNPILSVEPLVVMISQLVFYLFSSHVLVYSHACREHLHIRRVDFISPQASCLYYAKADFLAQRLLDLGEVESWVSVYFLVYCEGI